MALGIWATASLAIIILSIFLSRAWQQGLRSEALGDHLAERLTLTAKATSVALSQLSGEDEAARRCEESREYRPLPGCGGRADRWRESSPWGMPSRSPGRGPPYWKSRVLRRQALGDESDDGNHGGSVTSGCENAGCTARWRSLRTAWGGRPDASEESGRTLPTGDRGEPIRAPVPDAGARTDWQIALVSPAPLRSLFGGRRSSAISTIKKGASAMGGVTSKNRMEDNAEARVDALRQEIAAIEGEIAAAGDIDPTRFEEKALIPTKTATKLLRYEIVWVY